MKKLLYLCLLLLVFAGCNKKDELVSTNSQEVRTTPIRRIPPLSTYWVVTPEFPDGVFQFPSAFEMNQFLEELMEMTADELRVYFADILECNIYIQSLIAYKELVSALDEMPEDEDWDENDPSLIDESRYAELLSLGLLRLVEGDDGEQHIEPLSLFDERCLFNCDNAFMINDTVTVLMSDSTSMSMLDSVYAANRNNLEGLYADIMNAEDEEEGISTAPVEGETTPNPPTTPTPSNPDVSINWYDIITRNGNHQNAANNTEKHKITLNIDMSNSYNSYSHKHTLKTKAVVRNYKKTIGIWWICKLTTWGDIQYRAAYWCTSDNAMRSIDVNEQCPAWKTYRYTVADKQERVSYNLHVSNEAILNYHFYFTNDRVIISH